MQDTGSASVFHTSARDLAARLESDASPVAQEMVREAQALADTFRRWELQRPDDAMRVQTIRQLLDLNRRAMDYVSRSNNKAG